jgi:hypothetical protein
MFENMCLGNSIMSLDHTFKIMKEQMEMVTLGTVDNGRHGKTLAFGPSSHTDTMAVTDACEIFASFFRILISGIRNRALPDVWSESVKQATVLGLFSIQEKGVFNTRYHYISSYILIISLCIMCIIILYHVYHVPRRHMIYRYIHDTNA